MGNRSIMGSMGLIGYGVEGGDLVHGIGGGFPTNPVHAYIPMIDDGVRFMTIEDPPIAYRNQIRAKRVCDAARKRFKRRNPNTTKKFVIQGVTVK